MARKILEPNLTSAYRYSDEVMEIEGKRFMKGLKPRISPWLLFKGEHHFEHMAWNYESEKFPNGFFKTGTIRYKPGHIYVPLAENLLVFESSEFDRGERPRGCVQLKYTAVCRLEELTDEEIKRDGFESREDMLYQMTEMKGRYYQDLKPESMISYFAFGGLGWFEGDHVDAGIILQTLKDGGYWDELKKRDSSRWTKYAAKAYNGTFEPKLDL